jgi:enterochelin esterase-like enzyme
LYTGINNTDLFSQLGVFSSGWLPNQTTLSDAQYAFLKNNAAMVNKNLRLFWIAMGGKEDIAYQNNKTMMARFDALGIKYTYTEHPGGHTWPVWRDNLYRMAQVLFK